MIANKREFLSGLIMMIGFLVVLFIFFSPILNGKDGLDYLDNLFNSISKGSAYYIQDVKNENEKFKGTEVSLALASESKEAANNMASLFKGGGAEVVVSDESLKVNGDLGMILDSCLADSDAMYKNEGEKVSEKYGYNERLALYSWWKALNLMDKELTKQKKFKEAKIVSLVVKKGVETSYNYYQIEPQSIGDRYFVVVFSLLFYVIYTMWYGFAILMMLEGWGMKLGH